MRALATLPFLGLCVTRALLAQAESRADVLAGRVTDVAGHPVADAVVGATSLNSGLIRSGSTDTDGHYKIFFPETARQYVVTVKRMGFAPAQRTISRRTSDPERMTIDLQLGGMPLALSMVEITGGADSPPARETERRVSFDATVPNPVVEILALRDTLHLSAVQIVGLTDVADSLQLKNGTIYKNVRTLLAKSQEAGDPGQMAGSVAMMLEEASGNTAKAVAAAERLLRPEQWQVLPQAIRDQSQTNSAASLKQ
jgi:carboxypeptidase family protein